MREDYQDNYYERPEKESSHNGTMTGLGMMAVGILIMIVVFTIIPIVGSELDENTAGMVRAGSSWNSSENANIPTAVDLWNTVSGILKVVAVMLVVVGFLSTLKGLKGRDRGYQ